MTLEAFFAHVAANTKPPADLPDTLLALWFAEKRDWDEAHRIVQGIDRPDGSWIHAHLHREEGDPGNAGYWYARARRPVCSDSIEAERTALIRTFLPT